MNKVMLIGNVGADPQVKYLDQGVCVAQLRLATTERGYTLQNGTQVPDRTEWHNCIFWRKLGEIVEKYVHKGDKLYIEGKIQSRDWTDRQGISRRTVDIMVDNMELLSSRPTASLPEKQAEHPKSESDVVTPSDNNGEYPF
ncbi:MAG: single-stranded DNA-binding protein [Bacteroidaceae bacterium]|nr:single-stranded DNA-binding protein [Bacteroidaceae bacterium]MDO5482893.1 single-stranded DNA-binding protein [Bacteroidaceae bacterium]